MRALLIHNPAAGTGDHAGEELVATLRLAGFDVRYCSTRGPDFPAAMTEPADLVVIAGGDGTVRKVLTRLPDRSVPVAILPRGTANNIARSLGLSGDARDLTHGWKAGRTRRFSLGMAIGPWGERPFVEAVGYGALAAVAAGKAGDEAEGDERLRIGRKALLRLLGTCEPLATAVDVDGRSRSGNWLAIEVLNSCYTGPGLLLCPDGHSGGDSLDVLCIREEQRSDILDWLAAPGRTPPPVDVERGRCVRFEWDGRRPLRIDDKSPKAARGGPPAAVTVQLQAVAVHILLTAEGGSPENHREDQPQPSWRTP